MEEKKVIIVTGASRGIGAATSKLLAAQGYSVCVNYLSNTFQAEQVVQEILNDGGEAFAFKADVSLESEVEALFSAVNKKYGTVTHLVNNVGVLFSQASLLEISLERFKQVMEINVGSCFLCTQAFVKQFAASAGAIVNVSSLAALSGSPFEYIDYAASKGAMDALTKGFASELVQKNIRVNGVRPGFILTEIHADGGEPNRVERLVPQIPMKRGGLPEEAAEAIAWLLSDKSSYTTGSFIDVAGGK